MLLSLARDIMRILRIEDEARLDRIEGGVALQGPGVGVVLRANRIELTLWNRSKQHWNVISGRIAERLGFPFPVVDLTLPPSPVRALSRAPKAVIAGATNVPVDEATSVGIALERTPTPSETQEAQDERGADDAPEALDAPPVDPDEEHDGPGW